MSRVAQRVEHMDVRNHPSGPTKREAHRFR